MKKIVFETVSRYDVFDEPVQISIPFREGSLLRKDVKNAVILDNLGRSLPAQFTPTAIYNDESIKFLHCVFLANFPKNSPTIFHFDFDLNKQQEKFIPVTVEYFDKSKLIVSNGKLTIRLSSGNESPILSIDSPNLKLDRNHLDGIRLYDQNKKPFEFKVDEKGWEIVDSGPIRVILRGKGYHRDNHNSTWFSGVLTITLFAHSSYITFDHQVINSVKSRNSKNRNLMSLNNQQAGLKYDTGFPTEIISALLFTINLPSEKCSKRLVTSSFNPEIIKVQNNEKLEKIISADTIIETPNEMFPEVLFSVFGLDWETQTYGLCASIFQAYQNFPKALSSSADSIVVSLFPQEHTSIAIPQGVAKTSKFHLYFHDPNLKDSELIDHLLRLELPAVGNVELKAYEESGVFSPYLSDKVHHPTERFIYRFVDSRAKGLGFLHFGDGPEWEYVKQGRSKGKDIWINNEYDMPHNFMVMFARTGDRRYFDYFMASIQHWIDVDLCHFHELPYHEGLLYTHSVDHVSGQPVPSHQWVEGFLDYYHATGDRYGLDIALTIGDRLAEMIDLPMYKKLGFVEPRELGWTLRAFLALYNETYNDWYLSKCEPIIETYCKWADEFGTWSSPYPDNYMDRVPFMIHVGVIGLYQYYRIKPSKRIRTVLLKVINDTRRECLNIPGNMFMGKQHPAVRYQNLNGMVLQTMAIGYELSKDVSYLESALGMFSWIVKENPPPIYDFSKIKRDDFTVIYNCPVGPKRCAQTLLPLLHYYSAILQEGLLPFEH